MKNNLAINNEITESICLLDEACNIYPGLLEVRTKYPNIFREFEFDYRQLCYSINSEIVNFSDAKNTLDTMFLIHVSNLDFNDQKKQNVSFLQLSEARVDQLMIQIEQFKLWIDCILRTQP